MAAGPHEAAHRLPVAVRELHIPVRAGTAFLPARLYRNEAARRCLAYFHGGFFTDGALLEDDHICRALAASVNVVSIGYPLTPGSVFPDTIEAAYDALRWVQANHRKDGATRTQMVVGGREAGAALAAGLALMYRDRAGCRDRALAGQLLIAPMLDPLLASSSVAGHAGHPGRGGWDAYLRRPCDLHHPYASPLYSRRLFGLPPALLVTGREEPLCDEAGTYASKLRAAGVPTTLHAVPGRLPLAQDQAPLDWLAALLHRHLPAGR